MPQRPLKQAWASLRGIYGSPGQRQAPDDVEFDLPVQIVHDVSKEAEYATEVFLNLSHSLVTGGAGAQAFATVTLQEIIDGLGGIGGLLRSLNMGSTDKVEAWYHGVTVKNSGANFTNASVGIVPPNDPASRYIGVAGDADYHLVGFGNQVNAGVLPVTGATDPVIFRSPLSTEHSFRELGTVKLPERWVTISVASTDNAGGATTTTFAHILSFTPSGVLTSRL